MSYLRTGCELGEKIGHMSVAVGAYSLHIERPLEDVVRMDVVAALAFGGGH